MKRFDDAIREFAEAIKLDKNHVYICQDSTKHFATFFRAACHLEMKSYDKAIKDFTAALALDPEAHYEGKDTEDTECYRLRGLAYAYKKEYALAARDYRKAIELDPDGYQGRGAKQLLLELPSRFPKKTLTIPR